MKFRWLTSALCFAIAALLPEVRLSSSTAPDAEPFAESRPDVSRFRLGDAAEPFGWSTAIGDFDSDGQPDVVIADHVGGDRNEYRITLEISGSRPTLFEFTSPHDALTIDAVDVDGDGDLDVTVSDPVSGQQVGLWLNDGRGHFVSAQVRSGLPDAGVRTVFRAASPEADARTCEQSPRSGALDFFPVDGAFSVIPSSRHTPPADNGEPTRPESCQAGPRAPPSRPRSL